MMSRIRVIIKSGVIAFIALLTLGFSALSCAQEASLSQSALDKPFDRACLRCHEESPMLGQHSKETNPNNLKEITCTNCHGRISKDHRDGAKDVMRFTPDKINVDTPSHGMFSIVDQNTTCMSCHEPEKLREAFWQHDVHMLKMTCTNCHQVHPVQDPMKGLNANNKAKVKLCVDCHSELHNDVALKKDK